MRRYDIFYNNCQSIDDKMFEKMFEKMYKSEKFIKINYNLIIYLRYDYELIADILKDECIVEIVNIPENVQDDDLNKLDVMMRYITRISMNIRVINEMSS